MFSIFTDTSANLDCRLLQERQIRVIPFTFTVDGVDQTCTDTVAFDGKAYYDAIRNGAKVRTSQVTPQTYIDAMTPLLSAGQDVLFVGMSSGISGSYASAQTAAAQLREEFPGRKICLVDTLSASLGEGLLVLDAADCRDSGMSIEDTAALLDEKRHRMAQVFTVEDLKHLRATGRLSNIAALIGMVLQIKPLLKGDPEGKIVCFEKVRGRKRSIAAIAEQYDKMVKDAPSQTVGIAHADCPEDAAMLEALLKKNHPPKAIMNVCYEPMTGSHVGPGALALFFFGGDNVRSEL